MKKILSLVLCLGVLLCACSKNETAVPIPQSFDSSIAFAADTHYVATDDTKEKLSARQVPYSREIVQAMLYDCQKNGFDTLLLLGDLTNTGSESEHREISQLLAQARDEGLDIYVVPGECDLLTIGEQGFRDTYADFGFSKAVSLDSASLSYSAIIKGKLVIMLDTTAPHGEFAGEISDATLQWTEQQLIYAQNKGLKVITASHSTLVNYVPKGQTNPYDMPNGDKLVQLLNKYYVKLHLSGHRHSRQVNSFGTGQEIMIDMPTKYPNAYGNLYFSDNELTFIPHTINVTEYAKTTGTKNRNLLNFEEYSKRDFGNSANRYAKEQLYDLGLSKKEYQAAYDTFIQAYNGHMDGTLYKISGKLSQSDGYAVWQSEKLCKTRHGQWMPVWLDKCNSKSNGFTMEF